MKGTPPSSKNFITLSQHKRVKKVLHTPLSAYKNLAPSSWRDERLPELLWCALILRELPRDEGLGILRRAINLVTPEVAKLTGLAEITHTSLASWPVSTRERFIESVASDQRARVALAPLAHLRTLPAHADWLKRVESTSAPDAWTALARAVAAAIWHQSEIATDCRWLRVVFYIVTGKIKFPRGMKADLEAILNYPNQGDLRHVRPLIRAQEQALGIMMRETAPEWSEAFWKIAMENTRCLEIPKPKLRPRYAIRAEVLVDGYLKLISHWGSTTKTTGKDARHEGVFGLALFAMSLLWDLCGMHVRQTTLARLGLRTLLEVLIALEHLSQSGDEGIWKKYREFGAGQAKLTFLHLDALGTEVDFISKERLQALANADLWQDLVPMNIGHWAEKSARDLAEATSLKPDYDKYFNWTSGFVHGRWGAVADMVFEVCGNPLHRMHIVPGIPPRRHGDVVPDAMGLVNRILAVVEREYPGLGLVMDVRDEAKAKEKLKAAARKAKRGTSRK